MTLLTRFTISSDALRNPSVEPAGEQIYHEDLTNLVYTHGMPIFGSEAHFDAIMSAISKLDPAIREIWAVYVQGIKERAGEDSVVGDLADVAMLDATEIEAWHDKVDVILISPSDAERLGWTESEAMRPSDSPPVVRARYAHRSPPFAHVVDHRAVVRSVLNDTSRENIAKFFLEPLLPHVDMLSVADPYLGDVLRKGPGGACDWLIQMVQLHAKVADTQLVLFSTFGKKRRNGWQYPLSEQVEHLDAILETAAQARERAPQGAGLSEIQLRFVEDHAGRWGLHDRFILLEHWGVISLSRGLGVFGRHRGKHGRGEHDVVYSPRHLGRNNDDDGSFVSYATKLKLLETWRHAADVTAVNGGVPAHTWKWNGSSWVRDK